MVDEDKLMEKLEEINRNIRALIAVVLLSGKDEKDRIRALSKIGLSSSEIESTTGIPARTVRDMVAARSKVKQ